MRIETEIKLDFKDVLIRPKRSNLSSRREVNLERTFKFKHSKMDWTGVPIISANMDTTGTFEMAKVFAKHKMLVALHKHYQEEELVNFFNENDCNYVFYSLGITETDFEKFKKVNQKTNDKIKLVCVDVANGYTECFLNFIEKLRKEFPDKTILAGNVVTGEMVEALILAGADIVKVGIGPGSVCTTRKITGVGYPQLSATIECADAAHGLGALICTDGGLVTPGDFAKAFGAGGDFLMSGTSFAGTDESDGDLVERDGKKFKQYYGMSSDTAMNKHNGGVAKYRASEGKTTEIPYKGPVENQIQQILGGLRSACTYVGASILKDLSKCTTFIRVTQQLNESNNAFEKKN